MICLLLLFCCVLLPLNCFLRSFIHSINLIRRSGYNSLFRLFFVFVRLSLSLSSAPFFLYHLLLNSSRFFYYLLLMLWYETRANMTLDAEYTNIPIRPLCDSIMCVSCLFFFFVSKCVCVCMSALARTFLYVLFLSSMSLNIMFWAVLRS